MRVLRRYLLSQVMRSMLNSILFFAVIVLLLDLFTNINLYISHELPLTQIAYLSLLYLPKAVSYAIAPSLLFAITFTISSIYARNELVSILNSGVSYYRFITVLIVLGLAASLGGFLFGEFLVIDTYAQKEELTNTIVGYSTSYNNNNVVLISHEEHEVYYARYYNDKRMEISGLIMITRDESGSLTSRVDAKKASYMEKESSWMLDGVTTYTVGPDGSISAVEDDLLVIPADKFTPEEFRDITFDIQEMKISDARAYIDRIRTLDMGLYRSLLTDYYERFAFSLTPFIVVIISCSLGSRFKKNILLYSLLISIIISVVYYVFEMLTIVLAKQHYISPMLGAWLPVGVFTGLSILMLRKVRT